MTCSYFQRFQESAETFEKYFEVLDLDRKDRLAGERIIETQNVVTALHEHATMSMLAGNMLTTESVLSKASELYKKVEYSGKKPKEGVHVSKDIDWLNKLLEGELGVALNKEKKEEQNWFTEEMVYFFDEDIIGLMLSAEAQIRQGMESCKITIGKLMVIFAKYFAQMNKKEIIEEDEKICSTLTGALAAKVCLEVVRRRVKSECQAAETERMLRRALNCNESDKDVLHEYCKFLQAEGRLRDAQKLWQSLYEKETSVSVNYCQSLALRYLLRSNVTRRDLEKIQLELNSNEIDIDLERLNINEI